jgi:drug/metabolite transporter (DMT)-like permease
VTETSEPSRPNASAELALLLITAIWGSTFLFIGDALREADPMTFLAMRFGLAASAVVASVGGS